ncbi:hypothetical protein AVEN_179760-1 [Araneus ventricosus]|uniref:Uncharacterized protein n=1 Tax=Araneus ventricosus TaxID=182803 RepID=A0A4Y2JDA2_ARAVE|nr:hypothetical protein AVEN_179760-1 [Araneus ventricosus]
MPSRTQGPNALPPVCRESLERGVPAQLPSPSSDCGSLLQDTSRNSPRVVSITGRITYSVPVEYFCLRVRCTSESLRFPSILLKDVGMSGQRDWRVPGSKPSPSCMWAWCMLNLVSRVKCFPLVWFKSLEKGVPAIVSSPSSDRLSKLRCPSQNRHRVA